MRGSAVALCGLLLVTGLAVDPFALASFDAPKRSLGLLAIVIAAACAWLGWRWQRPRLSQRGQLLLGCLGVLLLAALLSATCADQPALAWDQVRVALLWLLLLPLGAGAALADARWRRRIALVAVLVIALNALYSLLQGLQLGPQLPMVAQSGRFPTGALLGNEGYVALACALLGAASLAVLLHPGSRRWRPWAAALLLLSALTILSNRQLTAAIALGCSALLLLGWRLRQHWILPASAVVLLVLASCAWFAPLRALSWAQLPWNLQQYQDASTARVAAWAAAQQLIEQKPWLGHGPGSYADQSQAARQQAELRHRARLLPPITANAFVQAHQEYLQLAAEIGVPALLACLLALAVLLHGLWWRAQRDDAHAEPLVLLAVLLAGAIAALAWFPLQIPLTAAVLLLAIGRSWRLLATPESSP